MSFEKLVDYSEDRLVMVMYGYCKAIERQFSMTIPKEIKDLIHLFGKFYFKWNHGSNGDNYVFPDDPMKIKYNGNGQWSMLALKDYVLSIEQCDKFEWELRIDDIDHEEDRYIFGMGFVSHPISESIQRWDQRLKQDLATREKQWGTYINNERGEICKANGLTKFESPKAINMKVGSRFKLIFDFKEKKCSIYHNDEFCGCLTEGKKHDNNMPDKIIPAISCWCPLYATCTKFGPL